MKKITSIIFITILAFILVGCGNKNLEVTCTSEIDNQDIIKENRTLTVYYQGKKPIKVIDERFTTFLNPELELTEGKYIDIYYNYTNDYYVKNWNSLNAISGNITMNDNVMTTKIIFDIPNITDIEDLERIKEIYSLGKPKEFIKNIKQKSENVNITCTTK